MFLFRKHLSRRTVLKGAGVPAKDFEKFADSTGPFSEI